MATQIKKGSEDIKEDVKQAMNDRMKNPFIFSFICSWVAWNWLILYEVISFDDNYKLNTKIDIISKYINLHKYNNLTWYPIISSILVALIYLLGSAIFTFIFNFYNTTIKAFINKTSLKGDIVPIEYFNLLEKKYEKLKQNSDKYLKENLEVNRILDERNNEKTDFINKENQLINEKALSTMNYEKLLQDYNLATAELNDLRVFGNLKNESIKSFFIPERTYKLKINNENIPTIPKIFNDILTIRISENVIEKNIVVFDINTQKTIFYLENLKVTADGFFVSFDLKETHNKQKKMHFYMLRKESSSYKGYCLVGDIDVYAEINISEV